jgi:hypothetical protein
MSAGVTLLKIVIFACFRTIIPEGFYTILRGGVLLMGKQPLPDYATCCFIEDEYHLIPSALEVDAWVESVATSRGVAEGLAAIRLREDNIEDAGEKEN